MKGKPKLDVKKIAEALGAEPRGKVSARSGYFGAAQLVAELQVTTPKSMPFDLASEIGRINKAHVPAVVRSDWVKVLRARHAAGLPPRPLCWPGTEGAFDEGDGT